MAQPTKKRSTWQKLRKFINDIHLWLGLGSGLIVIIICFTGTVYVYNTELTEMAAPHLYRLKEPIMAKRIAPEILLEKVQQTSGGRVSSVSIPADPERTYQFNVKTKDDKSRFGTTYMVNPYTGEIVGNSLEKNKTKEFMGTMFSLHRWMLLDKVEKPILSNMTNRELGSKISGWATILFTLGCITGLIIWFPQKLRTWRQGLKIKFSTNWKRLNHDLHNTLAFYSVIFLLVMGLTGPQWSFEWYRNGLHKTLGTYKPRPASGQSLSGNRSEKKPNKEDRRSLSAENGVQFSHQLTAYLISAGQALPYKGNYLINLPEDPKTPVTISKSRSGFFAPAAGDRLTIDPATATVSQMEIFAEKPFNERIAGSIKALHVGNVYGGFTKLLYFFACLIATTLPVTGTLIWVNKLKKKRKRTAAQVLRFKRTGAASGVLKNG